MTREQIIGEVRRTAKENGGVPLGWRRFVAETGIKEGHWLKHWARWGDLLLDAGFEPNRLTVAYQTSELLEAFAVLTARLGRLPTDRDLRLADSQDSAFPSSKVFARLGNKSELMRQVRDYCEQVGRHAHVIELCDAYVAPRRRPNAAARGEVEYGAVYLIKSGRFFKVGRSNSAGRRSYEIALQLPEKADTVHVIKTDDPVGIEAYWHQRFAPKRRNGEWFALEAADVTAFKRRKFM
jgi:hypothetical protein